MAEERPKKSKKPKRARRERRFEPSGTSRTTTLFVIGCVGAAALGAGAFAHFGISPTPSYAQGVVVAGALALAVSLWFGDSGAFPVRVGEAGVAIERGSELTRLAWCDVERISVSGDRLVLKAKAGPDLELPIDAHPRAVARVLAEAGERIPDVLDVNERLASGLPRPSADDSELVQVEAVQIAGRKCAATGEPIDFERDARLCINCGETYLKGHRPAECVTCGRPTTAGDDGEAAA
jgi:hypothetical protein